MTNMADNGTAHTAPVEKRPATIDDFVTTEGGLNYQKYPTKTLLEKPELLSPNARFIDPETGQRFLAYEGQDGKITLTPLSKNPVTGQESLIIGGIPNPDNPAKKILAWPKSMIIDDIGGRHTAIHPNDNTSYVWGAEGKLFYGTKPIDEVVQNSYEEVMFATENNGRYPNEQELAKYREELAEYATELPQDAIDIINTYRPDGQRGTMATLQAATAMLLTDEQEDLQHNARRMMVQVPMLTALLNQKVDGAETLSLSTQAQDLILEGKGSEYSIAKDFYLTAKPHLAGKSQHKSVISWAKDKLENLTGTATPPAAPTVNTEEQLNDLIRFMEVDLILHMTHGAGNASTVTARSIAGTGGEMPATISGAIGSLSGPLHGGANENALLNLEELKKFVQYSDASVLYMFNAGEEGEIYFSPEVTPALEKQYGPPIGYDFGKVGSDSELLSVNPDPVLDPDGNIIPGKEDELDCRIEQYIAAKKFLREKIPGLGHAAYSKPDPRATEEKAEIDGYQDTHGNVVSDWALAKRLEKVANESPALAGKGVYPNVDFYSGLGFRDVLGFKPEIATNIFAAARTVGWCAAGLNQFCTIIRTAERMPDELVAFLDNQQQQAA